jgi:hypothetical protein
MVEGKISRTRGLHALSLLWRRDEIGCLVIMLRLFEYPGTAAHVPALRLDSNVYVYCTWGHSSRSIGGEPSTNNKVSWFVRSSFGAAVKQSVCRIGCST